MALTFSLLPLPQISSPNPQQRPAVLSPLLSVSGTRCPPPWSRRTTRRPRGPLEISPLPAASSSLPSAASSSFASSPSSSSASSSSSSSSSPIEALIFDCDGVILESEHLHRQAYNDAFLHFDVRCPPSHGPLNWSPEFYDVLQNRIGGGKPKMRWYFNEHGWPSSSILPAPPTDDEGKATLIDTIQDWKTERYKEIIRSGTVEPRPGVLRLMDDAKAAGIKIGVCSAATKSSVILCLENLIGIERFQGLACFLAGDDVKEKKPDPLIYLTAAKRLNVDSRHCLVVEDSIIGLQAATQAGMSCIITYTSSTADQDFKDAIASYPDLSNVRLQELEMLLHNVG